MKNRERLLPDRVTRLTAIMIFIAIAYIPTLTITALHNSPNILTSKYQTTCNKPTAVTSQISGYGEGSNYVKANYINGTELVYNFSTFQRRQFDFKMDVGSAPKNIGKYVLTVDGFTINPGDPTDYTQFRRQYEYNPQQNPIYGTSLPADAPLWSAWSGLPGRKGTVHFSRPYDAGSNSGPFASDQAFLETSSGTFATGVSGQIGYFSGEHDPAKSYIVNCLVDVTTLVNDIRSGNGSPVTFSVSVSAWRDAAANAAQAAAIDYNNRVLYGEITPSPTATNTPTNTPTATNTSTNTPTDTPTNTPTATNTPTDTPTNTPTDTDTPVPTATDTPTNTPTDVPIDTPTDTPEA